MSIKRIKLSIISIVLMVSGIVALMFESGNIRSPYLINITKASSDSSIGTSTNSAKLLNSSAALGARNQSNHLFPPADAPPESLSKIHPDVQKFIVQKYSDPKTRSAMLQFARAQQTALDLSGTKDGAAAGNAILNRSIICVRSVMGPDYYKNIMEIMSRTLDSEGQFRALSKSAENLAGQSYVDPKDPKPCDN